MATPPTDLGRSIDFSYVLGHELVEMAGKDRRLCAVTAAMAEGTGLQEFAGRLFQVGEELDTGLFSVRGKLPQRHIGAGAQDIGSGILVFNLVKIFQIGAGLRKAKPHFKDIILHYGII